MEYIDKTIPEIYGEPFHFDLSQLRHHLTILYFEQADQKVLLGVQQELEFLQQSHCETM